MITPRIDTIRPDLDFVEIEPGLSPVKCGPAQLEGQCRPFYADPLPPASAALTNVFTSESLGSQVMKAIGDLFSVLIDDGGDDAQQDVAPSVQAQTSSASVRGEAGLSSIMELTCLSTSEKAVVREEVQTLMQALKTNERFSNDFTPLAMISTHEKSSLPQEERVAKVLEMAVISVVLNRHRETVENVTVQDLKVLNAANSVSDLDPNLLVPTAKLETQSMTLPTTNVMAAITGIAPFDMRILESHIVNAMK